jgi:serine/threonine-protein kinase RIO1
VEAGVRVPKPFGYFNDTLVMELVTDAAGDPARA